MTKMIKLFPILIILLFTVPTTISSEENYLFISVDATVMASNPDELGRTLSLWAEESGGYFTSLSTNRVILRFPWKKSLGFRTYLNGISDDLFSYNSNSLDLRESILASQSGIEAREEILRKNMELVDEADFDGTLYLEQEILRLMSEIELLKGQLRKAQNDRTMAQAVIEINFQSHSLPQNIPSSFEWINSLSFARFIESPFYGKARGSRYELDLPSGFALVDNKTSFRAISPEGVRFQIRKGKNYPLKELPFWSSTLVRQMEENGYRKKDDGHEFNTENDVPGFAIEWGLSMGNTDYMYLTAIVPYKKSIYIIEAAGEIGTFKEYRESIYSALESFSP